MPWTEKLRNSTDIEILEQFKIINGKLWRFHELYYRWVRIRFSGYDEIIGKERFRRLLKDRKNILPKDKDKKDRVVEKIDMYEYLFGV